MKEDRPELEIIFLHCSIHQESFCKSVLHFNHVVKVVIKCMNFIQARGLTQRQFVKFTEETDTDHQDLCYHSSVRWLSLRKACQLVRKLGEAIESFLVLMGKVDDFSNLNEAKFPKIQQVAQWVMVFFESTYVCVSRLSA